MLAGLVAVGVLLRLWITVTWQPAFVGYYDAGSYALAAKNGVFSDPFRPAGYPIFLKLLHVFQDWVLTVTTVQHALGIATALVLYATVRRLATNPWVALIAPAVILLDGFVVLIEHAVLSDTLFVFFVTVALYTAVQAPERRLRYALLPGLLIACAATVRTIGLFLVPILLLWLVWPQPRVGIRRAAFAGLAVAVVLGGYLVVEKHQVGATGFSRASGWSSYSRVGQFADCSKFTPPKGTEKLCETRPPSVRPGTDFYFWSAGSPAQRAFGPPNGSDALVGQFAHAAIKAQPRRLPEGGRPGLRPLRLPRALPAPALGGDPGALHRAGREQPRLGLHRQRARQLLLAACRRPIARRPAPPACTRP